MKQSRIYLYIFLIIWSFITFYRENWKEWLLSSIIIIFSPGIIFLVFIVYKLFCFEQNISDLRQNNDGKGKL